MHIHLHIHISVSSPLVGVRTDEGDSVVNRRQLASGGVLANPATACALGMTSVSCDNSCRGPLKNCRPVHGGECEEA